MQSNFSICSGTLIHPEIVLYAGHCGTNMDVRFGSSTGGGAGLDVNPEYCKVNPDYNPTNNPDGTCGPCDQKNDFAYCKLPYAVDIPITPVAMGCEEDELNFGDEVAIIGFGTNNTSGGQDVGSGTKRWALATLLGISHQNGIAEISMANEPHICGGDSGGGAMKRYADGGWRVFGVTSTGTGDCNEPTGNFTFGLASRAVSWIEQDSGIDVSPCFDAATGSWELDPECEDFMAMEPGASFGSWNDGCVGGPTTGKVSTCGPTNDSPPDNDPPTVQITNPAYGTEYASGASINIDMSAMDAGWGVQDVTLLIDGNEIAGDPSEPYGFEDVGFPDGVFELQAVATDIAGNTGVSDVVVISVGEGGTIPPDPTTSTTGDGTTGTAGETGSSGEVGTDTTFTTGPDQSDDGGSGCACTSKGDRDGVPIAGLALLALISLRRRRARAGR
jgi:MYXO-CTERM domain-containing protein